MTDPDLRTDRRPQGFLLVRRAMYQIDMVSWNLYGSLFSRGTEHDSDDGRMALVAAPSCERVLSTRFGRSPVAAYRQAIKQALW